MCGYRYGVYEARGLNSGLVARAAARFARYSSAAAILLIASRDSEAACAWYKSAGRTFKRGGRGGSGSS